MRIRRLGTTTGKRQPKYRWLVSIAVSMGLTGAQAIDYYNSLPPLGVIAAPQAQHRPHEVGSIVRVGVTTASGTTIAMPPTPQAGDFIFIYPMRGASTTAPTVPSPYIPIFKKSNATATSLSAIAGYKIATGTFASASQSTSTGVFTTVASTLVAGQPVQLTGTIPGGFVANTTYFVIATNLTTTTVELSATQGGAVKIPTSSAACNVTGDFSGTWTNASEIICEVLRPPTGYVLLIGNSNTNSSGTATVNYPALPLMDASGNSWVIGVVAASNTTQALTTAFTGMTLPTGGSIVGASYQAALFDTNGGVTSWPSTNQSVTGTGETVSAVVEIVMSPQSNPLSSVIYHTTALAGNPYARGSVGNNFKLPVLNPSGVNNGIGIFFTCDGGATLTSVTGVIGTYTQMASVIGGVGQMDTYFYWAPGVPSGLEVIGVNFYAPAAATACVNGTNYTITTVGTTNWVAIGAASNTVGLAFTATGAGTGTGTATQAVVSFQYSIVECYGVATSGGIGGYSGAATVTTPASGSFTPTNNNANGGNLILSYFCKSDQDPNNWTSGIFPGPNFTMLGSQIAWSGGNPLNTNNAAYAQPNALEGYIQATAAPVNGSISVANEPSGDNWNCLTVAIPLLPNAGTAPPSTVYFRNLLHQTTNQSFPASGTFAMQCSAMGNLRVVSQDGAMNVQFVYDSDGNIYQNTAAGCQIYYAWNCKPNANFTVFCVGGGAAANVTWMFADFANANTAANPYIGSLASNQNVSSLTSVTLTPSPNPANTQGVVYGALGLGIGPGLGVTSPVGAIFDFGTYVGETDGDAMNNADLLMHYYYNSPGPQVWTVSITSDPSNSTSGGWVWFNTAPPPFYNPPEHQPRVKPPGQLDFLPPNSVAINGGVYNDLLMGQIQL
jgi:hypothetical protein